MPPPKRTIDRARTLRRQMTLPEVLLWRALRNQQLAGLRFRRQHPLGPYILDFYCPAARLAVEVDGTAHDTADRIRHDSRRAAWLAERGITVLRFAAADILVRNGLEAVLTAIEHAATARIGSAPSTAFSGPPPPR